MTIENSVRTVLQEENEIIPESSTPTIRFQIVDRDLVGFRPEKLRLTLWNHKDRSIINGRFAQNVLNMNNVTCDVNGNVEWVLQPEDTVIVISDETSMVDTRNIPSKALIAKGIETHIARFDWDWFGDTLHNRGEIEHRVQNMVKVPGVIEGVVIMVGIGGVTAVGDAV